MNLPRFGAVVLSGGRGSRMGTDTPKQYLPVGGRPLICWALEAFQQSPVNEIVLVASAEDVTWCRQEIVSAYGLSKVTAVVAGGAERYESVLCGLRALAGRADYVLIHDGARPLVTQEIIRENMQQVQKYRACITAVRAKDTIRLADVQGNVVQTPARDRVWAMQTPQTFELPLILDAYERALAAGMTDLTDDGMVIERMTDVPIHLVQGDYVNLKVTTPEDLEWVRMKKGL